MTFPSMLYTVLIKPLQILFEVIFSFAYHITGNAGQSIIVLSLAVNFLVLPLYRRADAMQEEEKNIQLKLQKGVSHIKKTFRGDERMLILQTYYRQNNYKPTYVLRGATSLFLEIPFFIAAYHFLSDLPKLNGASFGPIADLGKPDGLLTVAGLTIHLLPVVMTVINIISSAIYSKGYPLKTKVQLYAMAVFFLIFLYTSPSGLVFYWTLNNLFSLVKNIFYKIKNPTKVLTVIASVAGLCAIGFGLINISYSVTRVLFFVLLGIILQVPVLSGIIKKKYPECMKIKMPDSGKRLFLLACVFMTVLVGGLIPSALLSASPLEFVDIRAFYHPLWYVCSALLLAAGVFLVWLHVFYWLQEERGKHIFEVIMCIFCAVAIVNYMCFGRNLGVLSSTLQYEVQPFFSKQEQLFNIFVLFAVTAVVVFAIWKKKKLMEELLLVGLVAILGMSAYNVAGINQTISKALAEHSSGQSEIRLPLSKTGKNVIVMMMDRGMGEYIPYMMCERPELIEKFSGFTYYDNVISFGGHTNFASPALFGGYEYTPVEINRKKDQLLVEKQNEALKVMPVLFYENGYDVTVCDPTYAGYQWIPDLSIYEDYPEIKTYITNGAFTGEAQRQEEIKDNMRNFFCYSFIKAVPVSLQGTLYEDGNYRNLSTENMQRQMIDKESHITKAEGIDGVFNKAYAVLENLDSITDFTEAGKNQFIMLSNDTTHEPMLMQKPDYTPSIYVDNSAYPEENRKLSQEGLFQGERTLKMERISQVSLYHSNMAAMLRLGEWFDYLKENGVYDNTRIIIVSDHGMGLEQIEELISDIEDDTQTGNEKGNENDGSFYYPLLMVKDFDAKEFRVSHEFMTNADVPAIALNELVKKPVNPFTGNEISTAEKTAHEQCIIVSNLWETKDNQGNVFAPARWFSVKEDIWNRENWNFNYEYHE